MCMYNFLLCKLNLLRFVLIHFLSQATESDCGDVDLSGLPETAVDSDDDDDDEEVGRSTDPLMSRDIVRDCLEKDPVDRTDDDIGKKHATKHTVFPFQ